MLQQDHEHVEQTEGRRRHDEEVNGGKVGDVVLEERSPSLRGWLPAAWHETRNGPLRNVEPQLEQFAVNAGRPRENWRAPWCGRARQAPRRPAVDPFARVGTSRSRRRETPADANESLSRGERRGAPRATNSPYSAITRSGRGSGASIARSGYGSPSGGPGLPER